MPAAVAEAAVADAAPPVKKGRKKLIVILAAALLVLLAAGGAGVLVLKNRAAQAAALALDDDATPVTAARADPKHPPTFLPLDPFVVNLADRDGDRYAQIGITLELDSAPFAEEMKAYMPAVRNAILLILAQKTSHELLERSGKEQLAAEIQRESVRPMGLVVQAPMPITRASDAAAAGAQAPDAAAPAAKPATRQAPAERNPVRHVHFSNFIIQ